MIIDKIEDSYTRVICPRCGQAIEYPADSGYIKCPECSSPVSLIAHRDLRARQPTDGAAYPPIPMHQAAPPVIDAHKSAGHHLQPNKLFLTILRSAVFALLFLSL